jgi:hypothetical protein
VPGHEADPVFRELHRSLLFWSENVSSTFSHPLLSITFDVTDRRGGIKAAVYTLLFL